MRLTPYAYPLPAEASELLRHKFRAGEIGVGETEDEELVRIRARDLAPDAAPKNCAE
jgi:hypothetical protein